MSQEVVRLRNVISGEHRDVVANSDEYVDLINEVYDHQGSARPKWEITGEHHTRRVDEGDVQEEDLGYAFKPIPGAQVGIDEIGPERHPERALTEAEVEAGIESWEHKTSSLGFRPAQPARDVELIDEVPAEERNERGRETVGTGGSKKGNGNGGRSGGRKASGGGSGASGSGGSTASSGSAGSASGSGSPSGTSGSGGGNA